MAPRLGYVRSLDGIRGIAILLVLGDHTFDWPDGTFGVELFFVLSGFLITTLLLEEHTRNGKIGLKAFYVRRVRRLMPALYTMLAIYIPGGRACRSGVAARLDRRFSRGDVHD